MYQNVNQAMQLMQGLFHKSVLYQEFPNIDKAALV